MKSICAECKNCETTYYNDPTGCPIIMRGCKLYKLESIGVDVITGEKIYTSTNDYFTSYEYPKSYYKLSWWNKFWAEKEKVYYKACILINDDGNCKEFILCQ